MKLFSFARSANISRSYGNITLAAICGLAWLACGRAEAPRVLKPHELRGSVFYARGDSIRLFSLGAAKELQLPHPAELRGIVGVAGPAKGGEFIVSTTSGMSRSLLLVRWRDNGTPVIRRITDETNVGRSVAFAPPGTLPMYIRVRNAAQIGTAYVEVGDLVIGTEVKVTNVVDAGLHCSDSGRVLYVGIQPQPDGSSQRGEHLAIYELDLRTGETRYLHSGSHPRASPSGRYVTFLREDGGPALLDENTGEVRSLSSEIVALMSDRLALTFGARGLPITGGSIVPRPGVQLLCSQVSTGRSVALIAHVDVRAAISWSPYEVTSE